MGKQTARKSDLTCARPKPLPIMPTSIEILDLSGKKFTDGIPSEWGLLAKLKPL